MAESELDRAAAEYASQTSPFAGLQDFLLNRPAFDRGAGPTPTTPTLRTLDFADDAAKNQAQQYREMLAEQKAEQDALLESRFADLIQQQQASEQGITSAREAALANLRDTLQQETASSAAAQAAERSEVVKALEDRLAGVKESIATESQALRDQGLEERADIRAQQQTVVDQLQQNIDTAKEELAASQQQVAEAQTAAIGDLEDRQGSIIGDLTTRISGLNDDLGTIQSEIRADLAEQQATLSDDQKASADLLQQRIDSLNNDLSAVGESVQTETAQQTELLRGEREQLVSQLENQIGTLKDQVGALPLDEIQSRIDDITSQSQDFVQTATTERAELAQQIAALEAAGVTQQDLEAALQGRATAEDLESLRGDYQATGRLVEEALQSGQTQREGLEARIQDLQQAQLDPAQIEQQRQAAITGAIDPISQQIEALQGSIPQQIDVDALRQQITDEIMGKMPTVPTVAPNVSAGITAGGDGYTGTSVGSTYEPEAGAYSQYATTEGAAEMGATPYYDTGFNMSDGMADAMGYIAGGSLQDQINFADNYQGRGGTRPAAPAAAPQVAITPPPQVAVAPPPQVAATTPPPVAVAPPPPVQPIAGVAGIPRQNLFDPMSIGFRNMRMR
jgi:DNA repair exonuclease SbcCD ATPase subunit